MSGGDASTIFEKTSDDDEMQEGLWVIDKAAHNYDIVSKQMCDLVLER